MSVAAPIRDEIWSEIDADERALVALLEQLRDAPAEERHSALLEWARSPLWHCAGMLLEGWQGQLHREAYRALKQALQADTPGRRWDMLDHRVGRASIIRLLGLSGDAGPALYASAAFKTWIDDDARTWIAGAIGAPPLFDADRLLDWRHLDIRDVILWDPRTNEAMLAGEHADVSQYVLPDVVPPRLTVWGDCGAYFRAWAAGRVRIGKLAEARGRGEWAHPISEPGDGGLPGALLIGEWMRATWPHPRTETIAAGPGMTAAELHAAAHRAARLPRFEGV
jgi:hypothetical protein